MDRDAIEFIQSLPAPASVVISRVGVGLGLFVFLIGAYVIQARGRIDRANRELHHLAMVQSRPRWMS